MSPHRIAVVGLWHLGEVYSAGLAQLGHRVVGVSDDAGVVENLSRNVPPLPEPQLVEMLKEHQASGQLSYTTDISKAKDCNVVWLAFDTPVDNGDNIDLSVIFKAVENVAPHLQGGVTFVVSSQIPVGTSREIIERIRSARPDMEFKYVYTPENLRLGEAVRCFLDPTRIIIGASSEKAVATMKEIFSALPAELVPMSPASAEMGKHALNAFLAASICFANDLADIAEHVGADMLDVSRVLHSDPRIGPRAYLDAGVSFSGGTLNRDIKVLLALSKKFGIEPSVIESLYKKNESRKTLVADKLALFLGNLAGKTIALFGLTYKPGTKTLRRSYPVEVAAMLAASSARLRLHDPQAQPSELPALPGAVFLSDPYQAASGAHAIVVMTPWPQFKELDFARLASCAAPSAVFFDTSNFFWKDSGAIEHAGFAYKGIGRGKYET